MRVPVPVAVVALVLLAGCGSAAGPETRGTATVTPAPVPTAAPTAPSTPAAARTRTMTGARAAPLPPGVTDSGIANASALARAHGSALEGRSYRTVTVVNRSTASDWERTREVLRVDGDRIHIVQRTRSSGGNDTSRTEYLDGRTRSVRCELANGTGACPTGPPTTVDGDASGTVLVLLSGSESRLAGTESRVAGTGGAATLRHRLLVTGNPLDLGSPYGVLEARNYTATALVTPSGLVTELRASYDLPVGGNRIHVTVLLRFESIGSVQVTPPPWYGTDDVGDTDDGSTNDTVDHGSRRPTPS